MAVNGGKGRRNQGNQARGKAFMLGVEETRQDPNIVMDGKELRVLERTSHRKKDEAVQCCLSKEKKQEEIVVVKDFPEVFLDDLSGLPSVQKIEFQIKLIPRAMPVAKSPYRLAHSELEELSGQLKEL
ncbi:hypothetical protein Tco_0019770 [Tanacetum coccineum]